MGSSAAGPHTTSIRSRAALRASPARSGAVAVERFSSILMFPGSLLCHIIKGKQLQKSLNLTAKRLCQPPWRAKKLHKQGELSTAVGGSTPDPLSSRTLLSMHKYYRQKCSFLFWRSGCTPRFLDQFSRFVGLAIVTNRCTTQTLFPAVHLPSICFLYIGALAMELWALSKVGLKWAGLKALKQTGRA